MNYFDLETIRKTVQYTHKEKQKIEEKRENDRKEFLELLLDDKIIKNNRKLQEKYMELYEKYTRYYQ